MKTIHEEKIGGVILRVVQMKNELAGTIISGGQSTAPIVGQSLDALLETLRAEAGKSSPQYFGLDGALNRFMKIFPSGFNSKDFTERERGYKLDAKMKLLEILPLEKAISAKDAGTDALTVLNATNLVSPFEKMRLRDLLLSQNADKFIAGAARFAMGELREGLLEMEAAAKPFEAAKWTSCTYFPFLWMPERHMFLKPVVTMDFAERIGDPFKNIYTSRLSVEVYLSLIDMVNKTAEFLSDKNPQDNIDIQSFIWAVGAYKD